MPDAATVPEAAETIDPASAEAAYGRTLPRANDLPRESLRTPRTDLLRAVILALAVARRVNAEPLKSRFLRLPKEEFNPALLPLLLDLALATYKARLDADSALAQQSRAKLPVELVDEAVELRERALELVGYQLREDGAVMVEVASIRSGQGHRDLAGDLSRLGVLLKAHDALLKGDGKLYRAGDAARCDQLANRILEELGEAQDAEQKRQLETLKRFWTLLERTYVEVAATGRWLLRNEGGAEERFPSLYPPRRRRPEAGEALAGAEGGAPIP